MWKNETEYRVTVLKEAIKDYKGNHIAIYGTGDNAKAILELIPELNICAVVDDSKKGKKFHGYTVISMEDFIERQIPTLIIAAEAESSVKVRDRIIDICNKNNVSLLNMYGLDENSDIYNECNTEIDHINLDDCDAVLIQFESIAKISRSMTYEESLYCFFEKYRELLQERVLSEISFYSGREPFSLWDVYDTMAVCLEKKKNELKKIYDEEEKWWNNKLEVDNDIIGFLKDAEQKNKRIIVFSNCLFSDSLISKLLMRYGLNYQIEVVTSKGIGLSLSNGMLRKALIKYDNERILYVGGRNDAATMLALSYKYRTYISKNIGTTGLFKIKKDYGDYKLCANEQKTSGNRIILVCSYRTPEFESDAGSKTIYMYLKLLRDKNYDVKFMTCDFYIKRKYAFYLNKIGVDIFEGKQWEEQIEEWINNFRENIIAAWIHYPSAGEKFLKLMKKAGIKTVYYGHDLHFKRKEREYLTTQDQDILSNSIAIKNVEERIVNDADITMYPSSDEIEIIKKEFNPKETRVLTPYFYDDSYLKKIYIPENRNGLMFIGGFAHNPNVDAVKWFINNIYPLIWKEEKIPFYIVGSNEPQELRELNIDGVIHVGKVDEKELKEMYGKVKMVVVPLRYGAGVKGKVIDALYYNVPIVTTTIGAEGIPMADQLLEIEDNEVLFARKVVDMYRDNSRLRTVANSYKLIVGKYYSKDAAWDRIKDVFI